MKRLLWGAALTICSLSISAFAATPPPGTVSSPPGNNGVAGTQPPPGGSLNSATNSVSPQDLVRELRTLQSDVDRVLPLLTTFNQEHGATSAGGLTGILSRILGGRTNSNTSSTTSNVVAGIDQLLNTNGNAQVTLSAETLRQLHDLQAQLQPVPQMLQALNGPDTSVPPAGTIGHYPGATNQWGQPGRLTPTGR